MVEEKSGEKVRQVGHEIIWDDNRTLLHFQAVKICNELCPAHWHNHLEVLYITCGKMKTYINEAVYELHKGDICLVNPQEIHSTRGYGECEYYLLQIPQVHLERICADWRLLHFSEYIPYSGDGEALNRKLAVILAELNRLDTEKEKGHHLRILIQLYEFLYLLYTKDSTFISVESRNRTERDFQRIEQSMSYVRKHYKEPLTLAEVSKQLSVSPEYFCRLFKKYTGQTFLEYVSQVRLSHFYHDLLQTDESITFLLDKNGITSYKTFMKAFKEAYGTTPHKLRELENSFTAS